MSDATHQCTIFDEFDSAGCDISNTLIITTLEDLRGDGCSYTTDRAVINQALSDFSGDPDITMELSEDTTNEEVILTLTDNLAQPVTSAPQVHSNRIGCTERDEEGWMWYSRGEYQFNKNGGRGYYANVI